MAPIISVIPRKKALLVAVRYQELHDNHPDENPPFLLPGTKHDPPRIRRLLIDRYGYAEKDIVILMDDDKHVRPTNDTMIKAMKALVQDAQPGDHFVFSCNLTPSLTVSGHGSQIVNEDGTEEDGFDEVFWPVDVQYDPSKSDTERATNYIMDDDLKRILVDDLPPKAHLTVLLDCCHSGTGADLPFHQADNSLDSQWSPSTSLVSSPVNLDSPEFPRQLAGGEARTNQERTTSLDAVLSVSPPNNLGSSELPHRLLGSETKTNLERTVSLDAVLSVSSPVDLGPSGLPRRLLGNGAKTNPERTTSLNVILSESRSSTVDSKSSMLKRNPKRTGSMKMPYMARGGLISVMPNGATVAQTEEVSVDTKVVSEKKVEDLAHVTSWSACSDDQLGLDSNNGGILTDTFVQLLCDGHPWTNREMLKELNKRVFDLAYEAKPEFKKRKWALPQPKPCLGSLRPLDEILDEPFTF
ncbi:peptidase C14 [Fomitiporia mediterranea MF3/22]|uniref:peptidase C14 n=1 Tax=Fomitiporia mediterranea (strain MF3/22) TaxID=694068 RepID=UPI00044073E0|nr:peptidase C14 [Fomitiporia mediterranea MF3/22]EJC99275.1 peptidase C14 [Fomitiporia mediterranea MF3/22]